MLSIDQLKKWFKDHYEETLKDFFTFLSFPSISTDPNFENRTPAVLQSGFAVT